MRRHLHGQVGEGRQTTFAPSVSICRLRCLGRLDYWDLTANEVRELRKEFEEYNLDIELWDHFQEGLG